MTGSVVQGHIYDFYYIYYIYLLNICIFVYVYIYIYITHTASEILHFTSDLNT